MKQLREDGALKPIGLALTAVVAGLGAAAQAAPQTQAALATPADATRNPAQPDEALRPLAGDPVAPFSTVSDSQQPDLFEL